MKAKTIMISKFLDISYINSNSKKINFLYQNLEINITLIYGYYI